MTNVATIKPLLPHLWRIFFLMLDNAALEYLRQWTGQLLAATAHMASRQRWAYAARYLSFHSWLCIPSSSESLALLSLSVLNFIKVLRTAFYARRSQKRKKIQLSHKYLFTLLVSTGTKAARRMLMKLTLSLSLACVFLFQSPIHILNLIFILCFFSHEHDQLCFLLNLFG